VYIILFLAERLIVISIYKWEEKIYLIWLWVGIQGRTFWMTAGSWRQEVANLYFQKELLVKRSPDSCKSQSTWRNFRSISDFLLSEFTTTQFENFHSIQKITEFCHEFRPKWSFSQF
jgi:hypothetical protein